MLGSKMIADWWGLGKKALCYTYMFVKSLPRNFVRKMEEYKHFWQDFVYKLLHLGEANLNLGRYHLQKGNLKDAILRFKIARYFAPEKSAEASYQLGWCYFLNNNDALALQNLNLACDAWKDKQVGTEKSDDALRYFELKNFIENCNAMLEVPQSLLQQYRNLMASFFTKNFYHDSIHLPLTFVQEILTNISALPDKYDVLELGSNIGLVGYELKKRFPDHCSLTGVEVSRAMIDLHHQYYTKDNIYDAIANISIAEFLENITKKFNVIISFCGLSFTRDWYKYAVQIASLLQQNGYLSICIPAADSAKFDRDRKEFVVADTADIEKAFYSVGLVLLNKLQISLAKNNKYFILTFRN